MTTLRQAFFALLCLLFVAGKCVAGAPDAPPTWDVVEHRAFDFFWLESDPGTGLTRDRARNTIDTSATYTVASIAATGYQLAALPIGVSHGWITEAQGYARALLTLRFLKDKLPNKRGFYYHFVDTRTGARAWDCEVSSVDTALLVLGARVAGSQWHGTEVEHLADDLTNRIDWQWMQNIETPKQKETAPDMGWKPEVGFLPYRWQGYSEAFFLYCLALSSREHSIPASVWDNWHISSVTLEPWIPVFGGANPLFVAQMAPGFLDMRGLRDRQGRDWWLAWRDAHLMDIAYCARNPEHRQTYAQGFWGVGANDLPPPVGYGANRPIDGQNDGTVAPSAMLTAILFVPDAAQAALTAMWEKHGPQIWGRYGFSDAFNVDRSWYDPDVIGIDLGGMLLAIENVRTGLVWRLMRSDPTIRRGLATAGFQLPEDAKGGTATASAAPPNGSH